MAEKWYYVSKQDKTVGPVEVDELKTKFSSGEISEKTYIWNGSTVKDWTALDKVPSLLSQLKPKEKPSPPKPNRSPSRPPMRRAPSIGGRPPAGRPAMSSTPSMMRAPPAGRPAVPAAGRPAVRRMPSMRRGPAAPPPGGAPPAGRPEIRRAPSIRRAPPMAKRSVSRPSMARKPSMAKPPMSASGILAPPPSINLSAMASTPTPAPAAGGAPADRGNLLAAIQRGQKLNKVTPAAKTAPSNASKPSGGFGGGSPMSMQSEMASMLSRRNKASSGVMRSAPKPAMNQSPAKMMTQKPTPARSNFGAAATKNNFGAAATKNNFGAAATRSNFGNSAANKNALSSASGSKIPSKSAIITKLNKMKDDDPLLIAINKLVS